MLRAIIAFWKLRNLMYDGYGCVDFFFYFQAEDGIRGRRPSRGLGYVYKRQVEYIIDNMKKKLQALQYADQSAMQPGA